MNEQMFLCVGASFNTNCETCPKQHAVMESHHREREGDRMIGMRLFTENKYEG